MDDPVKLEKLDSYARTTCSCPAVGPVRMQTPRGPVDVEDVPSLTSIYIERDDGQSSVALLAYCPVKQHGYLVQLDANAARHFGASLLHLAEKLDGRVN